MFNVCDFTPFVGLNREDLRIYHFQEGGIMKKHLRNHMLGSDERSRAKGTKEGESFQKAFP